VYYVDQIYKASPMVTESTGMGNLLMTTMMVKMMATGMQARVKNQPSTGP